jgi:hypothetical protein
MARSVVADFEQWIRRQLLSATGVCVKPFRAQEERRGHGIVDQRAEQRLVAPSGAGIEGQRELLAGRSER